MNGKINFFEKIGSLYKDQDSVGFWSIIWSGLCLLSVLAVWGLNFAKLPTQIPLFYSLLWGEDQLVSLPQFIILPAIIVLMVLVNLIISWHLHISQYVIKRILLVSTAIISSLMLIAAIKIILTFI